MTMLARAALWLLIPFACLLASAPACAQHATTSLAPAGYAPEMSIAVVPASSTGLTDIAGTVTSTAVTPTKGAATFASGSATIGPLTPQLGRDIRVILKGTWAGTFLIGTSVDNCATINPLTIAGSAWGSYTGNANEAVDEPTLAGVVYCAIATVTSGTLTYGLRQ